MLSVDQLVPLPVVGEDDEIVVGELQTRAGWFHAIAPGHRLIVAVTEQTQSAIARRLLSPRSFWVYNGSLG